MGGENRDKSVVACHINRYNKNGFSAGTVIVTAENTPEENGGTGYGRAAGTASSTTRAPAGVAPITTLSPGPRATP